MKKVFIGIVVVFCILFEISLYTHKEEHKVIIQKVDIQQEIHNSDGYTNSENICRLYTDQGVFEITQSGFFAHPELIGKVKEGDTIQIETRGLEITMIGMYRTVTGIR